MVTGDSIYNATLRPKIVIKDLEGNILYTFDAFGTQDINVTRLETEGAVGEMGTFAIQISDNQNVIDKEALHECKVSIQLGKSSSTLQYFMIGYGDIFRVDRPITNIQNYVINGFGSAIWSSQLFIHKRKASKIQNIDKKDVIPDPKFAAWKLVKDAIEKKDWRPLNDESIKNITDWHTTGISEKVNTNIPVINAPFTYLNDFLDQICSITGAVWFIDFSSGHENVTLSYNNDLHTGVTILSGDLMNRLTDDGNKISYIVNSFGVEDAASSEAGVATRLYTSTIIDQTSISSSFVNKGSTSLNNKAIAQQVIIDSDARRLNSLAFTLRKIGEPDSPKSRVNGAIILDGGNNKPTGTLLDRFEIDLSSIENNSSTQFVNEIDIKESLLEGTQKKLWLVLYQRSGTTGDPIDDPANTIAWQHNGVFNSSPALTLYSGTAPGGDRDANLTWTTTNLGPTYTYAVFSDIRRLQARTNKQASNNFRLREQFVDTSFLTNPTLIGRYLSLNLSQMSKPRRGIGDYRVTVPNNFIFKPYQWVSFSDGLSGINQDLQVKRVRYIVSSELGDPQIGTHFAELTLGGLYNTLTSDCSCV